MKRIFAAIIIIICIAAAGTALYFAPIIRVVEPLDREINLTRGETWLYADQLSIELKEIRDSRCPVGVQCVWEGEISADLLIKDLLKNTTANETLGTRTRASLNFSSYSFTILDKSTGSTVFMHVKQL